MRAYTIGLDFGTESARALLLDCEAGREVASRESRYVNGVIDERLPVEGDPVLLPPDWALQDPDDYLRAFRETVPALIGDAGVGPDEVVGVGIDCTSCTMLPVTSDGTPLCRLERYRRNPHAWAKLWKHHAAQPQAQRIDGLASEEGETWLERYGGRVSSEWFFPKILQIVEEAPELYDATDCFLEAGDWIVWQLTGQSQFSACAAGYKAFWSREDGFPDSAFFARLNPRLEGIVERKVPPLVRAVGERAGDLTRDAAQTLGLRPGTAVATSLIDAHAAVPGSSVVSPSRMVLIMGTSACQIVLDSRMYPVRGIAGVAEGAIVPGLFAYEAGQPSLGDTFAWASRLLATSQGATGGLRFDELEALAAAVQPGRTGLLALDWFNGNRSVLDDSELSGMLLGATLDTTAADVYRALMESSAFGTRLIMDEFESGGVHIDELVACGGLAHRSELLLQIMSDVCGRPIRRAASRQASALGAAMFGMVAAGGAASIEEAAARLAHLDGRTWEPARENRRAYELLYSEYRRLYDYFGAENSVMRTIRALRTGESRG